MSIELEMEQMAEKMEKSFGNQEVNPDVVKAEFRKTIESLGIEGLKKAIPALNEEQKEFLKEVLEDMKLEKGGPGSGRKGHTTAKKVEPKKPSAPAKEEPEHTRPGPNDHTYNKDTYRTSDEYKKKLESEKKRSADGYVSRATRSGKYIGHRANHPDHHDWTADDHEDAMEYHRDSQGPISARLHDHYSGRDALSPAQESSHKFEIEQHKKHAAAHADLADRKRAMKKSHKEPIKDPKYTNEPVTNYSPEQGDYLFNEDERPQWDKRDEEIVASAKKKNQEDQRPQGGVPVEGWEGEKIEVKSDAKMPEIKMPDIMKKSEKEEDMSEKKAEAKDKMARMIKRMQERKMPKDECVKCLHKSTGIAAEKFAKVWDILAKSEGDVAEADQVKPAQSLTDASKAKEKTDKGQGSDETELKAPKKADAKKPMSGEPETKANDAMKKSKDNYFYEEEEFYKSKDDVFTNNRFGKNTHFAVDAFIEADAAAQSERLAKSTFDYDNEGEVLAKGQGSDNTDLPEPKKAAAKKKPASGEPDETADEAKAKVPALKKSEAERFIETKTDMEASELEAAIRVKNAQPQGAFLVKSFTDADMESAFDNHDMWKDETKKK